MAASRSPSSDGLPKEFYAKFFPIFGAELVALINLSLDNGHMTESQRFSLITLLCKDPKLHYLLKQWRPISLMNVDAKIVGKVLSIRLRKVMPSIIHLDQTCGVQGRTISDNVHLLRNVFDYVEQKGTTAALINLDMQKAFDRVSHFYLFRVLHAMGFGPEFIRWVEVYYTGISASVIVNGHVSDPFAIGRSVRQSCPLSPLLYVMSVEPLPIELGAIPISRDSSCRVSI